MNFFRKVKFLFQRPKVIVVAGRGQACAKQAVFQVLGSHFKIGKELLILEDTKDSGFFLKKSRLPILLITHTGQYYPDKDFFAGETAVASRLKELARILPERGYLVLNFDDEAARDFKDCTSGRFLTFGFGPKADIRATDIFLTRFPAIGTNFKVNHQGNTVPVWLEKTFGKEQIYSALSAASIGEILGLNLVEVSSSLRFYRSIPGKMQLIPGIKNSWILDDSAGSSLFSAMEALDILREIPLECGRKIAVLGDILGIEEYVPEMHENVGEKVAKTADLLFAIGIRAIFFAEGAVKGGMAKDKIFKFNTAKEAGLALQKEIKEGDLILIDGSEEISMIEIVEEIKSGPIV